MRKVVILGSTGSIGRQALEILADDPDVSIAGLGARSSAPEIARQANQCRPVAVALSDSEAARSLPGQWDGRCLTGERCMLELIEACEPDIVLNALVGAAGLGPTVACLTEGIDVALANKESLVIAGELVTALSEASGARLIPVDSEHSALDQLLDGAHPGTVDRLVLTASGGPLRGLTDLEEVTPEQALDHPTWAMGGRITVDSATLMNKGFEMIEAHHLFDIPYDRIEVVVHPQSIVHSLVDLTDGASLAHLGYPDMRVPISYALRGPDRPPVGLERLDLAEVGSLTFERPDTSTFRCLGIARRAGERGGAAPAALNAADEVAVERFLAGRASFGSIPDVVEQVVDELGDVPVGHFDDLIEVDRDARRIAQDLLDGPVGADSPKDAAAR